MTLVPNSPQSRMDYVVKTYLGTKNEQIIPDVVAIGLYTVGRDSFAQDWESFIGWPLSRYYVGDPSLIITRWRMWSDHDEGLPLYLYSVYGSHWARSDDGQVPDVNAYASDLLRVALREVPWPAHHPLDFIIPWSARELGRLAKAVRRGNADRADYLTAVQMLRASSTAIAMWSEQNNVDLMKTSLAEALEAIKDFEVDVGDVEPGEVVYEFEDGYTLQKLTTQKQLDDEGEVMQHCVAGYCEDVEKGKAEIYSLRDANGRPHVTIEWDPYNDMFVQIQGKQNRQPVEKYRPYLREVIREHFNDNVVGRIMIGDDADDVIEEHLHRHGALENVDFSDLNPHGDHWTLKVDFSGKALSNVQFGAVVLANTKWRGASLKDVDFRSAVMARADFNDAVIEDCHFDYAELHGALFVDATIDNTSFARAKLGEVTFDRAKIDSTNFIGADLSGASFEGATMDDYSYHTIDNAFHASEGQRLSGGPVAWSGTLVGGVTLDADWEDVPDEESDW